jgi:hypothetical protein
MRKAVLWTVLLSNPVLAGDAETFQCGLPDDLALVEAQAVVKVSPVYPRPEARRGIEACVVLGFGLAPRPGQDEQALFAVNPAVIVAPEEGSGPFVSASQEALEKWLFLASTHPPSDEMTYYAVFPFQINEE